MNIKNHLKISIRHLRVDKTNSIISISGLILGLGIVSIVLAFVLNEVSYNSSFANRKQIYRILNHNADDNSTWANTPYIIGETLACQFAEVEQSAHQYNIGNVEVKKGTDFVNEDEILSTESSFFKLFGITIREGNLADFDQANGKVLLSKTASEKYFNHENPVGQLLTFRHMGKEYPMEVAAVFEDLPKNSTIKATIITGKSFGFEHLLNSIISTGEKPNIQQLRDSWESSLFFTNYVLLKKGTSPEAFEKKLKQLGTEHSTDNNKLSLSIQPLSNIYFGSSKIIDNNGGDKGNLLMLYLLTVVGILILVIAFINYLNLASAQAMTQAKDFAVQKVCGAPRSNFMLQKIIESSLISLLALPFALVLAHFSLPLLSDMLGKSYSLTLSNQMLLGMSILLIITLLAGTFSGLLVSLRFSTFNLVQILKGNHSVSGNKQGMRKAMVVFQITVFIALMATMILVQKQVNYAFNKDLGIAKDGLLRIPIGDHNYELYKQEIKKNPNIIGVSGALWIPPHKGRMNLTIPKVDQPNEVVALNGLFVDTRFAETMGMKIIMGSDFNEGTNNNGVLVNQTAIKTLGLKDIIGEQTAFGPIIGVVNDFNMYSIHEAISPMLIGFNPNMCREMAVKISTENMPATINFLKQTWKQTGGTTPFDFDFTNDILNQIYDSDIRFSRTIGLLAVIAILIASLGLFGLSMFMGRQRTKEIGIRKVNGAKVTEVLALLNKDFVVWVAIAFIIATPIAYFAMNKWLENFAYKTELSWWIFALAGLLALGIALLTVSWQSWKAATRNPVEALRCE